MRLFICKNVCKKRKWNYSYVGFSFTCMTERHGTERPQCMIYSLKVTVSSYGFAAPGKPLLEALYKVSYTIDKEKKPHTIEMTLVKPCALEMAKIVLGEDAVKQLSQVSLSNDTLLVFVGCVHERCIKEDFLFCEGLETTTKAVDVFRLIQPFFDRHELAWDLIGSICTDGALAMIGKKSGFVAMVKEKIHMCSPHTNI
ncbi:protein FAM200C-like [Oratosquilla oratoria]|uniref:protein FAM200C-like n=1 Tax=Oratosquilla oratoria TaxID=337810 RepID=UPI003F769488